MEDSWTDGCADLIQKFQKEVKKAKKKKKKKEKKRETEREKKIRKMKDGGLLCLSSLWVFAHLLFYIYIVYFIPRYEQLSHPFFD